jgi:bifunctional lysine-specific demethylase and histidyl-hydroxylase NO66
LNAAEAEPEFRRSLPAGFASDPAAHKEALQDVFRSFARWVERQDAGAVADALAEKFWSSRTPVLTGQLEQVLALDAVSDASVIRRRRGAICVVKRSGEDLIVTLGDRVLVMPAVVEPAMRQVLEAPTFTVSELAPHLDRNGRLVLVRRLVREGLLEQVSGA